MISRDFLNSAYRELSESEYRKFQELYKIFIQKNSELNLSAIRDEQGVWEKHFYDSLLGAEFLEKSGKEVLDLGSGGGFPALPLAILFPEKAFVPFDSVQKKMKAVQEMANVVGLPNISVLSGRAEEFGRDPKYRGRFDVVTVRAFAPFSVSLELALPFLKVNGVGIFYRGPEHDPEDELLVEAFGGLVRNRKQAKLPSGDAREIWEIVKMYPTSSKFPRANGVPKKFPIQLDVRN